MKNVVWTGMGLIVVAGLISMWTTIEANDEVQEQKHDTIKHLDHADDFEALRAEERFVLVDFYADWCPPCRMLAPELEQVGAKMGHELLIVKVDVDAHQELARQYGVSGIPHLILYRNGKRLGTRSGYYSQDDLLSWIKAQENREG